MNKTTAVKPRTSVRVTTRPAENCKRFTGVRWAENAVDFEVWIKGEKVATTRAMNTAINNALSRLNG